MSDPTLTKLDALDMQEGAAINVRRLFPRRQLTSYDPFVQVDEFRFTPPAGFPPHPHRGFECVTYMLEGAFHHTDSLGNDAAVSAGGLQRFTAGRGLMHSEIPGTEGQNHGLQLWIALSRQDKQLDPSFQQVESGKLPETTHDGATRRILSGPDSPLELRTPVQLVDLTLRKRCHHTEAIPNGHRGLVYVLSGRLAVGALTLEPGQAALFDARTDAHTELELHAKKTTRCVLASGRPHGEPIRNWGTYVD